MCHLFPDLLGTSEKVTELYVETFGIFHLPNIDWSRLLKLRIIICRKSTANIIEMNILLSRGLKSLTRLTIESLHFSSTPLKVLECSNITHFSVEFDVICTLDFEIIFNNPRLKHLEIDYYYSRMELVLCILRPLQDLESLRVCVGLMSPKRSEALGASSLSHKATLQILILHNLSLKLSQTTLDLPTLQDSARSYSSYVWYWAKRTF